MGGDGIRASEMRFGMTVQTDEIRWTEGDAISILMILSDVKEQEITSLGTLPTCFCSSDSQKKRIWIPASEAEMSVM